MLFQPQPDDVRITYGGIQVVKPPDPTLTGVVESRDPEEWKFVEALLPSRIVPEPPKHSSYPTPSGWVPPKGWYYCMIALLCDIYHVSSNVVHIITHK